MENALKVQEGKLRKLSIEYYEELYPHLMSVIAERRYVSLTLLITFFLLHLLFADTYVIVFIGG